jgi:putative transposase
MDRIFWVLLSRLWPVMVRWLGILLGTVSLNPWRCQPTTVSGRTGAGRPMIGTELRELIRRMSRANPLWGAPRIHGELLKLGLTVSQATVSKYMVARRRPPSQAW